MWSVSGARAGYRLANWKTGEYRNRGSIEAKENLKVADWDAQFLPLRDSKTTDSNMLTQLASKLGASSTFAGKNHLSGYSNIEYADAKSHLYH